MKKGKKTALIIGGILLALGIILTVVAFIMGASLIDALNNGDLSITESKIEHFFRRFDKLDDYVFDNSFSADAEYTVTTEGITAVTVDWVGGEISVLPTSGDKIVLKERKTGSYSEEDMLTCGTDENGVFRVSYCSNEAKSISEKELELYIPSALLESIERLEINTVSADIELSGISTSLLVISSTSGEIDAESLSAREVSITSISGETGLEFSALPDKLCIEGVNGSIELNIPRNSVFTLSFDSASGKLKSDLPITNSVGADCTFDITTVSGDLEIEYDD